jgi:hypothetical protein
MVTMGVYKRPAAHDVHHTLGVKVIGSINTEESRPVLGRLQVLFYCFDTRTKSRQQARIFETPLHVRGDYLGGVKTAVQRIISAEAKFATRVLGVLVTFERDNYVTSGIEYTEICR